jgi:hypothetical protein
MSFFNAFLLLLSCSIHITPGAKADQTIVLSSAPGFQQLQNCGWCCFCQTAAPDSGTVCSASDCVSNATGCSINSCLCGDQFISYSLGNLTKCIQTKCGSQLDVEAYQNAFQDYCNAYKSSSSSVTPTTQGSLIGSPFSHLERPSNSI